MAINILRRRLSLALEVGYARDKVDKFTSEIEKVVTTEELKHKASLQEVLNRKTILDAEAGIEGSPRRRKLKRLQRMV
jgi:hypothetical protein